MTSLPRPILVGIAAAWAAAIGAQVAGVAALANHDSLLVGDGPPVIVAALIALLAWQVMIAANMVVPINQPGMGIRIRGEVVHDCYPDCNADGATTVADFGCFQTKFVAGDPYADCNADGALTVADFGCFQTKFVVGCP